MDIKEIQNLIRFVAKSGATEVKLEMDDFKITIKTTEGNASETTYVQMPMQQNMPSIQTIEPAVAPVVVNNEASQKASEEAKYVMVKSPMIGTFYRKPSPDKPVFVEVGTNINKGDVVCVIEAMKLFNEIESEISGKIVKVFAKLNKVVVENLNLRTKFIKKGNGKPGEQVKVEAKMSVSNVMLIDEKTKKRTRVGYKKLDNGKKVRISKVSNEVIE